MAGSFAMLVDRDTGKFDIDLIETGGDAAEALADCYDLIYALTGGDMDLVNAACAEVGIPLILRPMVKR